TDRVHTVTQMLRKHGVVGKFCEFFGSGLDHLPLADRATIANMAPEYGATCGIFPIDGESLSYLRLSGRSEAQIALVEAYAKAQGLWRDASVEADYSAVLALDMGDVKPSLAGPKRPQDRVQLRGMKRNFQDSLPRMTAPRAKASAQAAAFVAEGGGTAVGNEQVGAKGRVHIEINGKRMELRDGAVVIAAITSCTNTSNPAVMLGAGLLARNAVKKGLKVKPWVKTSLGPGSQVVTDYLAQSGLQKDLDKLGFNVIGYGCTTCIGNSGPLADNISKTITDNDFVAGAVLSGNRNFEGRVHPLTKANY